MKYSYHSSGDPPLSRSQDPGRREVPLVPPGPPGSDHADMQQTKPPSPTRHRSQTQCPPQRFFLSDEVPKMEAERDKAWTLGSTCHAQWHVRTCLESRAFQPGGIHCPELSLILTLGGIAYSNPLLISARSKQTHQEPWKSSGHAMWLHCTDKLLYQTRSQASHVPFPPMSFMVVSMSLCPAQALRVRFKGPGDSSRGVLTAAC